MSFPSNALDLGLQLPHLKGLGDEIRNSGADDIAEGISARMTRHDDDRKLGVFFQSLACQLHSVFAGHPQVGDQQLEGLLAKPVQRFKSVRRSLTGVMKALEKHLDESAVCVFIVRHENIFYRPIIHSYPPGSSW